MKKEKKITKILGLGSLPITTFPRFKLTIYTFFFLFLELNTLIFLLFFIVYYISLPFSSDDSIVIETWICIFSLLQSIATM